jgi:integrase
MYLLQTRHAAMSHEEQSHVIAEHAAPVCETAVQLSLFPVVAPQPVTVRRRRRPLTTLRLRDQEQIMVFEIRAQALGSATKTARDYASQLRTLQRITERITGKAETLIALFGQTEVFGKALAYGPKLDGTGDYTGYATDGRRHAARKFATVYATEIEAMHGEPAHVLLDRALRTVYHRVGTIYKSPVPRPRRRGGMALRPEELDRLIDAVSSHPGVSGLRDSAAMRIMAETGCRINALRHLDAADCHPETDGRLRLLLHGKGRREPAEYLLSSRASTALMTYVIAYNADTARRGNARRIQLPGTGPVWRSDRGRVGYSAWRAALARGCADAGVTKIRPHDLRRTFATLAEGRVGRHQTALAGWWHGTGTMDRHYVSPRPETIDDKWRARFDRVKPIEHTSTSAGDRLREVVMP